MREIAVADDSRNGDDDLMGRRTELPDEPYIWEFHVTANPEWEDESAPQPETGGERRPSKEDPP